MKRSLFRYAWLLVIWIIPSMPALGRDFIDKSETIFFPPALGQGIKTFKAFPSFWWNFLVLDYTDESQGFQEAHAICQNLKRQPSLAAVECEQDLTQYQAFVADWANDYPRRFPPGEPAVMKSKFDAALGRLSLPLPKALFSLMRSDPLEAYEDLRAIVANRLSFQLERLRGFLVDKETKRIAIPIQPNFGPSEQERTEDLLTAVFGPTTKRHGWGFLGPHASTLENRSQVTRDLETVSWIGLLGTVLFFGFLLYQGHWRLLLLLPPVIAGAALSAATVVLIFGSIHGLTLSFGGGIIGLTIDYGLHVAYNGGSRSIWRSNLIGFLTTIACLIVLMFSSIPLLKQLMVFSALGFGYSYLILYYAQILFPHFLNATPMKVHLVGSKSKALAVWVMLAGVGIGCFVLSPKFDPRQFDFQEPQTRALANWFYTKTRKAPPLFQIFATDGESPLPTAHEQLAWAVKNGITVENVAQYLPTPDVQRANLARWSLRQCGKDPMSKILTEEQRQIFAPFLSAWECDALSPKMLSDGTFPAYLRHLEAKGDWLTLWLPNDNEESRRVQERFPDATSLLAIVSVFPNTLAKELRWMAPLSLAIVWLLLWYHFQSVWLACVGMLPFLAGVGFTAWVNWIFKLPVTFISLIAVVMLLGLSVDYAIFAVDYFREGDEDSHGGTATALIMAWVTTIVGFAPLAFCRHPVLSDLGLTLTLGTIGTMAGAFWAVPLLVEKRGRAG